MKTQHFIHCNQRIATLGLAIAITLAAFQYGLCAVGYVNTVMRKGWSLVVNPLSNSTNHADIVMGFAPEGTSFYRFDSATQNYKDAATFFTGFGWCPVSGIKSDAALILVPGEAYWVESPQAWTNTFVGDVLQGNLTNPIPAYYSLKGSLAPQSGLLQTDLKFPARQSDGVWKWLGTAFDPYSFAGAWTPTEPAIGVSDGFIVWRDPAQATPQNWWGRTFNVLSVQSLAPPSNPTTAEIHSISVRSEEILLQVRNAGPVPYNVQFSRDGQSWTTVATKVHGNSWSARMTDAMQGFYQLVNP